MKVYLNRLHLFVSTVAGKKKASVILFMIAFVDASFIPMPITTLFIILALYDSTKAFEYSFYVIAGTLIGSLAGYFLGKFLWIDTNGKFTGFANFLFNNVPGFSEVIYAKMQSLYSKWGFWILFLTTFTPAPYNLLSIFSGAFDISLSVFVFATFVSLGIKFIILSFGAMKIGPEIIKLISFNPKLFNNKAC